MITTALRVLVPSYGALDCRAVRTCIFVLVGEAFARILRAHDEYIGDTANTANTTNTENSI